MLWSTFAQSETEKWVIITIDRRERCNAQDEMTARDLRQAARAMARNDAVRCVVLRGTGGVFYSDAHHRPWSKTT